MATPGVRLGVGLGGREVGHEQDGLAQRVEVARALADTSTNSKSPPTPWAPLPSTRLLAATRPGVTSLSILLTATMIGTSAARAQGEGLEGLRLHAVVGRHDEDRTTRGPAWR